MADKLQKQIILSVGADTSKAGSDIDQLKTKIGNLNETEISKPFKGFKTEIKEATLEAAKMESQFGKNSEQFVNAAKRVADLRDRFGEFNTSINAFSPDNKLQSFVNVSGAAIKTVQGLQAGINLLGIQSGTAEQAIQRLQAIMAFSDVLNSIDDIKNGFSDMLSVAKNAFKSMSKGDLIGLAIIGVAALGTAVYALFENTKELTEEQKRYNKISEIAFNKEGEKIAQLQILTDTINKGKLSQAEKNKVLDTYNTTLGDTLGKYETYQELEAAIIENGPKYIKYLETKAKADAAYGLLVEEQRKLLEKERTDAKEFTGFSILGIFFDDEETYNKSKEKVLERARQDVNEISNIYSTLNSDALKLASGLNISTPTSTTTPSKPKKESKDNNDDEEIPYEYISGVGMVKDDYASTTEEEKYNKKLEFLRVYNSKAAAYDTERYEYSQALSIAGFKIEENIANSKIALDRARFESNQALISGISSGLQGLSQLAKKDSIAAKGLAASAALIDTYAAIVGILKSTARTPAGGIPGFAIAQAVATGIFGLVQVRNILKTPVDGNASSTSSGINTSAPKVTAPVINASAAVQQQPQDVRVTNNNQAPIRAYITNNDLVNNEQKNKFINSISTF